MLNLLRVISLLFITEYFIPGFTLNLVETIRSTSIIDPIIETMANILENSYNNIQSVIIN